MPNIPLHEICAFCLKTVATTLVAGITIIAVTGMACVTWKVLGTFWIWTMESDD